MECPFQLVHTKVYSPFLTIDKHIERFRHVKFPCSKETQLQSAFPPPEKGGYECGVIGTINVSSIMYLNAKFIKFGLLFKCQISQMATTN